MKKNSKIHGVLEKSFIIPEDKMTGKFRMEIFERSSIYIYGCRRILSYSPERVIISLRGDALEIVGEQLVPAFFYGGTISLRGNIIGIKFLYAEEEK